MTFGLLVALKRTSMVPPRLRFREPKIFYQISESKRITRLNTFLLLHRVWILTHFSEEHFVLMRFSMILFLLMEVRKKIDSDQSTLWDRLIAEPQQLDFWEKQRHELIHSLTALAIPPQMAESLTMLYEFSTASSRNLHKWFVLAQNQAKFITNDSPLPFTDAMQILLTRTVKRGPYEEPLTKLEYYFIPSILLYGLMNVRHELPGVFLQKLSQQYAANTGKGVDVKACLDDSFGEVGFQGTIGDVESTISSIVSDWFK